MNFQERLQQWTAKEPERLLVEMKDLRMAKEASEAKLEKIEKRLSRVRKRIQEIRSTNPACKLGPCGTPGEVSASPE